MDPPGQFIGSTEELHALSSWIDQFTRAVANRCVDDFKQHSYQIDLGALNKALAIACDYLACLNPMDADECAQQIRNLQKEVAVTLADGLVGLLDLSDEQERAYKQCQSLLKFTVPHFQRLGVRLRDEMAANMPAKSVAAVQNDEVTMSIAPHGQREQAKSTAHSTDFRSVSWFGKKHEFTTTQAGCVRILWENWEQNTPAISEVTILDEGGSGAQRLRDVFAKGKHSAWGTMIHQAGKGAFKLAESTNS